MARQGFRLFPFHKARPDQAGFFRRFLAFTIDSFIIVIIAFLIYLVYVEITAAIKKEPGLVAMAIKAIKEGGSFLVATEEQEVNGFLKKVYLQELKKSFLPKNTKAPKK